MFNTLNKKIYIDKIVINYVEREKLKWVDRVIKNVLLYMCHKKKFTVTSLLKGANVIKGLSSFLLSNNALTCVYYNILCFLS